MNAQGQRDFWAWARTSPQGMLAHPLRALGDISSIAAIAGLDMIEICSPTAVAASKMTRPVRRLVSRPHVIELQGHALGHRQFLSLVSPCGIG